MALMRGKCSWKAVTLALPSSATASGAARASPPPAPLKYLVDLNSRLHGGRQRRYGPTPLSL